MMKISLYKFVTTFCLVPVTDWGAFVQRVVGRIFLSMMIWRLIQLLKQPLFIASLIAILIWSPDTIMWIFIKLGNIELKLMILMMTALMPDIFGAGSGAYTSWTSLWSAGLTVLPVKMLEIINGLGVGQILGLVTSTWAAVSSIKIYRKIMLRAGLL